MTHRALLLAVLTVGTCCTSLPCPAGSLDDAISQSRQTGVPLFVLATSQHCPPCRLLKRRIETEAPLQRLLDQYVAVHLDVNDPAFETWTRLHPPRRNAVPMVFIVASTGQEIYNNVGIPANPGLAELLEGGIERNRQLRQEHEAAVTRRQAEKLARQRAEDAIRARRETAAKVQQLIDQGKYGEAIAVLLPHLDEGAQPRPNAAADSSLRPIAQRLTQLGQQELTKATDQLADDRDSLFGLLGLARTRRLFGDLPTLTAGIQEAIDRARRDPRTAPLLASVQLIDRGRAAESLGHDSQAIELYREVVATYPGSLAANVCSVRLAQMAEPRTAARDDQEQGQVER
jgi:hypothetical protein